MRLLWLTLLMLPLATPLHAQAPPAVCDHPAKEVEAAIQACEASLEKAPSANARYVLGRLQLDSDQFEQAVPGPHEAPAIRLDHDRRPRGSDARVDHADADRVAGEGETRVARGGAERDSTESEVTIAGASRTAFLHRLICERLKKDILPNLPV